MTTKLLLNRVSPQQKWPSSEVIFLKGPKGATTMNTDNICGMFELITDSRSVFLIGADPV